MNIAELTRALVDIESITNNEEAVGTFLLDHLSRLAARTSGHAERCEVEAHRFNVLAHWGDPLVTLSTHMDTVPPFFPSREDDEFVWGRGSADAKGIIASMVGAAEGLLEAGVRNFALLFVVGEERNSAGAYAAARNPRGSRYLINGEPTENKLALASKGMLRYEVVAQGKLAHSAYPELGESAIEKLLDALQRIRAIRASAGRAAGSVHAQHRHDFRRARAERDCGRGHGGDRHSAGRRSRAGAAGDERSGRGAGRSAGNPVHPGDTL